MQITGTITDTRSDPIANVRVDMSIDGIRAAVVYTDDQGRFSHTDSSRTGGVLSLRAEMNGYIPQEITRPTTPDQTVVDIVMEPATAAPPWRRMAMIAGAAMAVIAIIVVLLVTLGGSAEDPVTTDPPIVGPDSAEERPTIDRPLPPVMIDRPTPVERIERVIPPLTIERPMPPGPVDGPVPVQPSTIPERPGGVQ